MKNTSKSNEITVSTFADKHRLDRRTISRRIAESGLQPLRKHRGRVYYDAAALLGALSESIEKTKKPKTDNLLRIVAEGAVRSFATDSLGVFAAMAYELAKHHGLPAEQARKMALQLWIASAGELRDYLTADRFNATLAAEAGMTVDQFWKKFGLHDESKPPTAADLQLCVPKCVQEWAMVDGYQFKNPLPLGDLATAADDESGE